jgi:Uma2 family endonuclease
VVAPIITKKNATYQDVLDAPEHLVAEIIDGELNLSPRPATRGTVVNTNLGGELFGPFHRGRGGPGGWIMLFEPELHLGKDVLVPDLAAWRRERMSIVPETTGIEIVPDWVCEVLSPSTQTYDRTKKARTYARKGVKHMWLVHPKTRTVEVMRLHEGKWLVLDVYTDQETVRAEPFDAIELDLANLFTDLPDRASEQAEVWAF